MASVDGLVNEIATVTGEAGGDARKIQTGRLQFYALMLVTAVAGVALILWISRPWKRFGSMHSWFDWALTLVVFIPAAAQSS